MTSLFKLDLNQKKRIRVNDFKDHFEIIIWLNNHGEKNYIYEIWKINKIHSRWCWKIKKERWGRMATPKNKNNII